MKHIAYISIMAFALAACSSSPDQGQDEINQLSSPVFSLSGSGTSQIGQNSYIFATSLGTVGTSSNSVLATFSSSSLPLSTYSSAFFDQMNSGNCSSLNTLVSTVTGGSGNQVSTQISATGCTDQSVINVLLDTTQVFDNDGYSGTDILTAPLIIDVAPMVSGVATGNTALDGSGSSNATPGAFSLTNDSSVVVTFSKSLNGGAMIGALNGCAATLGTPTAVNATTISWPLTGFSGLASGTTCSLNVSAVSDAVGNPDDPNDANLNMTITFQ